MGGFRVPAMFPVADTLIVNGLLAHGAAIGKLVCETLHTSIQIRRGMLLLCQHDGVLVGKMTQEVVQTVRSRLLSLQLESTLEADTDQ